MLRRFLSYSLIIVCLLPAAVYAQSSEEERATELRVILASLVDQLTETLDSYEKGLAIGSRGTAVSNYQNILVRLGFLDEQYVTGYYGTITRDARNTAYGQYSALRNLLDPQIQPPIDDDEELTVIPIDTDDDYTDAITELPAVKGPFAGDRARDAVSSFGDDEKITMTHFFYWYDKDSGLHMIDPDGTDALTSHPASYPSYNDPLFSYRNVEWYEKEFRDMIDAGIDVALLVYWGFPGRDHPDNEWSDGIFDPLEQALRNLEREGLTPPQIGMFYDTSTLQVNPFGRKLDLRDSNDREFFWGTIRDFWSQLTPKRWAQIDGEPLTVLYADDFVSGYDATAFSYVDDRFEETFAGKKPYFMVNNDWGNVGQDATVAWSPSLGGAYVDGEVAQIGPGFDETNVQGRTGRVRDRDGGDFYRDSWRKAIRGDVDKVVLETWNEYHEANDISHSYEYGRTYIHLTNAFANAWKGLVNDAHVTARTTTINLDPRERKSVGISIENTGSTVWSAGAGFEIVVTTGNSLLGEELTLDGRIEPGDSIEKTIQLQAPNEEGIYYVALGMNQEDVISFGSKALIKVVVGNGTEVLPEDEVNDREEAQNDVTLSPKGGVSDTIVDEYTDFVTAGYRLILDREPDVGGLEAYSVGLRGNGLTAEDFLWELFTSKEYSANFANVLVLEAPEYVDEVYRRVLQREADAAGRDAYINGLSVLTRREVFMELMKSGESQNTNSPLFETSVF